MNPTPDVGLVEAVGDPRAGLQADDAPVTCEALDRAIGETRQYLLSVQQADGYWVGELEGDTILESEYVLLLAHLGRHESAPARKAAQYILDKQLPDGGWSIYPGGPVDVSASVKAYFALKLTGHDPSALDMQRARRAVVAHGGADAVNSFTRFYLALLGQISYDQCPAVPPQAMLLPSWLPINIYRVSAWSRTILVPLSIMWAYRPVTRLPAHLGIAELFLKRPEDWPPLRCPGSSAPTGLLSWDRFFRALDRSLKTLDRWGLLPLKRRALAAAERWMLDRFVASEGLGAIFPPMIWSVVALKCLGYSDDTPELQYCYEHLEGLAIENANSLRLQPCKSPVWDTAITLKALSASGVSPDESASRRGRQWLLDQEIRQAGDWAHNVSVEPSGWCFEHANAFYPDVDDTTMVLMALEQQAGAVRPGGINSANLHMISHRHAPNSREAQRYVVELDRAAAACRRAIHWVQGLQNRDGGWGAFDRDNDCELLCKVPFADHNAMIDPSTPDLSGRVLEMLGQFGWRLGDKAIDRAVGYLRRTQEADGSWFGRWGVNYVYGTWQTLTGLAAVGLPADDPTVIAGVNWLICHQQPSGGWGESPDSYAHPHLRGQGPATASQTAWAVLGLLAAGQHQHPATLRGIRWLLGTQQADGTWVEEEFTGTGFPRVFYLRYHMYPIYFPLLALAQFRAALRANLQPIDLQASTRTSRDSFTPPVPSTVLSL